MQRFGTFLMIAMLLAPGLAAGQSDGPLPDAPSAIGAGIPPWLTAQAGPPPQPPGPGPQPSRPPRGMGPGMGAGMGAWWKNSEIVKKLGLSEAQVGQIEQTFLEHRLRLVDLRADLEKQELRLQPLIDADRPDEAKVVAQIDLITAARGKLEKENAMMLLAIRRVLGVEQWKTLQTLQQERGWPGAPPLPPGPGPQLQPPRRPPADAPRQ